MSDDNVHQMENAGHNRDENAVMRRAAELIKKIDGLKDKRGEINSEIQAAREAVNAMGIPKPALDMAMKYLGWDDKQRQGFDVSYNLVRRAIELPIDDQRDFFDVQDEISENAKAADQNETD